MTFLSWLSVFVEPTWAQPAPSCTVDPMGKAARGETITAKMHVVNDGTPCALSPRVGSGKAESISLIEPPANGHLEIGEAAVRYTPHPGFSGQDVFVVAWFGHGTGGNMNISANFRTRVEVDVRSKP